MSLEVFEQIHAASLEQQAQAVAVAARDVATGTVARDHMIPQIGLSVALQAVLNEAIGLGDLDADDVVHAFGSAFGSFIAQQRPCPAWRANRIADLSTSVSDAVKLLSSPPGGAA